MTHDAQVKRFFCALDALTIRHLTYTKRDRAKALTNAHGPFIVVVDNGDDLDPCFEDMGVAVRRCRIDFGAEIRRDAGAFSGKDGYQLEIGPQGQWDAAS